MFSRLHYYKKNPKNTYPALNFLKFQQIPGYRFEKLFLVYILLLVQVCENDLFRV